MRSTSLKTSKSPPTSPRRKKIVRFADTLGLDLAAVKTIMQEDLPLVPDSAFDHLDIPKDFHTPTFPGHNTKDSIVAHFNKVNGFYPSSQPRGPLFGFNPATNSCNGILDGLNGFHIDSDDEDLALINNEICVDSTFVKSSRVARVSPSIPSVVEPPSKWRNTNGASPLNSSLPNAIQLSMPPKAASTNCSSAVAAASVSAKSPMNASNAIAANVQASPIDAPALLHFNNNSPTGDLSPSSTVAPWLPFPKLRSTLIPEFVEPFVQMSFIEKVKSQSICLENCYINPSTSRTACVSVTNCIRVLNKCYEKSVFCRYTSDNWSSYTDVRATYIPSSSDSWSDRFTVTFNVENLTAGQRVQFALRFLAGSDEFWDNNSGANYSLMYRI